LKLSFADKILSEDIYGIFWILRCTLFEIFETELLIHLMASKNRCDVWPKRNESLLVRNSSHGTVNTKAA